jgi:hypothetical protein
MAIRITSGEWLCVEPSSGAVEPSQGDTVLVIFDSSDLPDSLYTGQVAVTSNDPDSPIIVIPATLGVGAFGPSCDYVIGDINSNGICSGADVIFAVNCLRYGNPPPDPCDCPPHGIIFPAGDVNGSCAFNGIDVTYLVTYFKGGPELLFCPDCPPIHGLVPGREVEQPVVPTLQRKMRLDAGNAE